MRASIIRIGNSRGIRIPKVILEQCRLGNVVELTPRRHELVVRPLSRPRSGWDEAFKRMALAGDDALLEIPHPEWDQKEWSW